MTKRYGSVLALDHLDLSVPAGEVFGFLGPNGAGKTTAMRTVFGIVEPDEGQVLWDGRPISRADRQRFGYMPEERGLYPRMRVREQLVYLARLHGVSAVDASERSDRWLDVFGLADRGDDDLEKLSLGNQQRVQLAAALVHEPEVLVLDEPFSGLDPIGVDVVAGVLRAQAARGCTVLFSSHQLDLVQHFCRSVAVVARGRPVLTGTVDALTAGDGRTYELEAQGDLPAVDGVVATREPDASRWTLQLAADVSPQRVLQQLAAATPVTYFALRRRPLSEVFREAVAA